MRWPTWDQAAIAGALSLVLYLVARRARPTRSTAATVPAAKEFALVAGLYTVWRLARQLPLTHEAGAIDRGRRIDELQQAVGLPSELSLQRFVLDHEPLAWFMNTYYAIAHVPGTIAFLVGMFVWKRNAYPRWRTVLAITTACCLFIRFVRVAPPRLVPELGYVDLSAIHGLSVYGPVGTGVSDQFAAMPSIHVAWAAIVSFGLFAVLRDPWRWVAMLHLALTTLAVSATGHHWWLDSIVAVALVGLAVVLDRWVRRRADARRRRQTRRHADEAFERELAHFDAS